MFKSHSSMKKFLWFFALIALGGCSIFHSFHTKDYLKNTPPGTVLVSKNLYIDYTEITNIDWREYMFYTHKVYGKNSKEYQNTILDTLVWSKKDSCLNGMINNYLRHPAYNFYPAVGMSQEQVKQYCHWRSNVVMESILIDKKIIREDPDCNSETNFTIERYYSGQLNTYLSDERLAYYPKYRLPSPDEFRLGIQYADSINRVFKKGFLKKDNQYEQEFYSRIVAGIDPCSEKFDKDFYYTYFPTKSTGIRLYRNPSEKRIIDLQGHVGEWTNIPDISFGGSWNDSLKAIQENDLFPVAEPNAWTGFRNVCEWVKWDTTNAKG